MKHNDIIAAVQEASRFLQRAQAYLESNPQQSWRPSKERAALRRSSLDLTRSLSKMRKNQ